MDEHPGTVFQKFRNNFFGLKILKILKFFDADPDPGSRIFLTMDLEWKKFGSRINIPDVCLSLFMFDFYLRKILSPSKYSKKNLDTHYFFTSI